MMADPDDRKAPPDKIWVCMRCGRTSEDRFGMEGKVAPEWDSSCTLNAKLYFRSMLRFTKDGRVEEIVEPQLSEPAKIKATPPKVVKAKPKAKAK